MAQNWNDEVKGQLNNLPGFPAIPNTTPPVGDRWVLGDWIDECHVRPEVADAASLPLTGNEDGDVRMSRLDEAWFVWDAGLSIWKPVGIAGGGIATVTGVAPINVTPGANPIVSHDASGVVAGTYGDAANVSQVTVDAKGHVTSATQVPIFSSPIGSLILGTGPIQTINADTDQITPVALLHRIQTNGTNKALTSTPQINLPGAVIGQVLFIQNVDAARHVDLANGVAEQLSLSNANKRLDPGGTILLVYNGSLWVEVSHTQGTTT